MIYINLLIFHMIFPIKSFPHLVTHKTKNLIKSANFFHVKCLSVGFFLLLLLLSSHNVSQTLLQQKLFLITWDTGWYICLCICCYLIVSNYSPDNFQLLLISFDLSATGENIAWCFAVGTAVFLSNSVGSFEIWQFAN